MRTNRMLAAALLVICLGVGVAVNASGQNRVTHPRAGAPGEWRAIGQVTANLTADHDVIVVKGPFDNFRRIKFKVTHAPVKVHAARIRPATNTIPAMAAPTLPPFRH